MVEFHAPPGAAPGWHFAPGVDASSRLRLPAAGILCTADFLIIFTLPAFGSLICQDTESLAKNLCFWSLLALFSVLLTVSHGGYRPKLGGQQRVSDWLVVNWFLATSLGMLILAVLLGHPNILTRRWVILDLAVTPVLLVATRHVLISKFVETAHATTSSGPLVICYDAVPSGLAEELHRQNLPDHAQAVLYLSPAHTPDIVQPWPVLRDINALRDILLASRIKDIILIHHPSLDHLTPDTNHALWQVVLTCPARIWLALDVTASLPQVVRQRSGGCRLVPIVTDELLNSNNLPKRIFDLILASLLLILSGPLFLVCASLIRLNSPGPVIFRQMRTGAQGRQFQVLKFRTMTHDPKRQFSQARRHDPRVTRIGHWLRRSSLDELPQFLNVIRGDMSLVGPRPHAPETLVEGMSFENALKLYQIRHRVKPGITGLAQIRGLRGATPVLHCLEQRLASDLEYIQSWSIWLDLSILLRTVPAVLGQTNAW